MNVIVELSVPADAFALGRILAMEGESNIVLETMVPLGERSVPFFRLRDGAAAFEQRVRGHPAVEAIHEVSTTDDDTLYALDWRIDEDTFFAAALETDAHVLEATGTARSWAFELRFPSHDRLSTFQRRCIESGIPLEVTRIYNPTKPDAGPWFGLTTPQREALTRAVEAGYYSIPRRISTQALAEEFAISDQAVSERLRRAIVALTTNALRLPAPDG